MFALSGCELQSVIAVVIRGMSAATGRSSPDLAIILKKPELPSSLFEKP